MKIFFTACTLLLSLTTYSQSIKNFHLNFALGAGIPPGVASESGFLVAVEPKFGLGKNLDIGLRYESATMKRGTISPGYSQNAGESQATQSLLLTTAITANGKTVRPFFGIGCGLYFLEYTNVSGSSQYTYYGDKTGKSVIGTVIRGGVKLKRLVLNVDYNLVPATDAYLYSSYFGGSSSSAQVVNSYWGLKVGIELAGLRY
ncbi:hypothetical protein [Fibrivirga algicola]|uniref:Outer membrane protein beta-barrel domain-containing protein n=1 Tax=Fibrivirga algicola TaxID=2950420 RepID=A0ABX0QAE5_9BACT|nr:hypothetical protein [Fibrivirga algicola]NID09221.1 hypothetical protein [Fibrivirga algicola]